MASTDLFGHVFDDVVRSDTQKPEHEGKALTVDKKLTKQFQTLEYENNKRNKAIAEKKKYIPRIEFMTSERTTELTDGEITKVFEKKRWKGLDVCFKWKVIEKYLAENSFNVSDNERKVLRDAVRHNLLGKVKYDHTSCSIVKMNFIVGDLDL